VKRGLQKLAEGEEAMLVLVPVGERPAPHRKVGEPLAAFVGR
jgi:hypothetical protein